MTKTSTRFLFKCPNTADHIEMIDRIRGAIRKSGFRLRLCGRNPNRKQFYHLHPEKARTQFRTKGGKIDYSARVQTQRGGLQQDLPLEYATEISVYAVPSDTRLNGGLEHVRNLVKTHAVALVEKA